MKTLSQKRHYQKLTEPDYPAGEPNRKTWSNTQECAHRWAANRHNNGKCGNVFFERGAVFSYGCHFPMARHVKRPRGRGLPFGSGGFVLYTTRTYSVSTSRHLSEVRRAIPDGCPVFNVLNVMAENYGEHLANLTTLEADALACADRAKRARGRKAQLLSEAAEIIAHANEYAAAVGLRERLKAFDAEAVAEWAAEVARKNEAAAKRGNRKAERDFVRQCAEWDQALAAWRDGGEWPGNPPRAHYAGQSHFHPAEGFAFLRVRGARLETSMRAVVPVKATIPILAHVRAGTPYDPRALADGEKPLPEIDGFRVSEIDAGLKTVRIGCHRITFEEIERAAKSAGL